MRQYAELIKMSNSTFTNKINGKTAWKEIDLFRICAVEKVKMEWLNSSLTQKEMEEVENEGKLSYAAQKLQQLIKTKAAGNISRFGRDIGVAQPRISRLFSKDKKSGRYPSVTEDIRKRAIERYGLPSTYFQNWPVQEEVDPMKAFGDMKLKHEDVLDFSVHAKDVKSPPVKTKPHLPITAAAGSIQEYLEGVMMSQCDMEPVIQNFSDYDFTITVSGNSMIPYYQNGDEIACKKVERIVEPGSTYLIATIDGAVLKRVYEERSRIKCVSFNKDEFPDFFIDKKEITGIYRVVGMLRSNPQ